MVQLRRHQEDALKQMSNGCVLYGGTGSGKGFTALHYFQRNEAPKKLIVITTARKRNDGDWRREAEQLLIFPPGFEIPEHGSITVDSWNNVKKYVDHKDCFFIFDEQRAVGRGTWAKSFIKIAKQNNWILLTATPGDTWADYIPVFVANGFYKNRTDFQRQHVIFKPHLKYPVVDRYIGTNKLNMLRNKVLVEMPYESTKKRYLNWITVEHSDELMKMVMNDRWNPFTDEPIRDPAELFRAMRKVSNIHTSRLEFIKKVVESHKRVIVFYNFDYEIELIRTLSSVVDVYEYNGHKKDVMPAEGPMIYAVQYVAGAEAWNCTTVDAMVFYSLTYSWKNFVQAQGRIDRLDSPFEDLFYYMLVSNSKIDRRVQNALKQKKDFNEHDFLFEEGIEWDGYSWMDDPDLEIS